MWIVAKVSRHGYLRSKERIGLNKRATDKIVLKALEYGISHKEVGGTLSRYFDFLYLSHGKGNNIRIYAERVFIFDDEFLITVFNLPNEFKKLVKKALSKRREHA